MIGTKHVNPPNIISCDHLWIRATRQPGDLGVLRGVADGVAEEARTRGFASSGFPEFARPITYLYACHWRAATMTEHRLTAMQFK